MILILESIKFYHLKRRSILIISRFLRGREREREKIYIYNYAGYLNADDLITLKDNRFFD